jgi:hypothetical protein
MTTITTNTSADASTLEERQARQPLSSDRAADPAPDPVVAARQRAVDFVHNICTTAQLSIRERRDELDNLMERMSVAENALSNYIGEFANFSAQAMKISAEIKESIADAALPFKATPPATITQLKPKE